MGRMPIQLAAYEQTHRVCQGGVNIYNKASKKKGFETRVKIELLHFSI